jgi:hypothetical protein
MRGRSRGRGSRPVRPQSTRQHRPNENTAVSADGTWGESGGWDASKPDAKSESWGASKTESTSNAEWGATKASADGWAEQSKPAPKMTKGANTSAPSKPAAAPLAESSKPNRVGKSTWAQIAK